MKSKSQAVFVHLIKNGLILPTLLLAASVTYQPITKITVRKFKSPHLLSEDIYFYLWSRLNARVKSQNYVSLRQLPTIQTIYFLIQS